MLDLLDFSSEDRTAGANRQKMAKLVAAVAASNLEVQLKLEVTHLLASFKI